MTTTESELERQVREEQEEHDAAHELAQLAGEDIEDDLEPEPEPDGQVAAFDRSQYDREDLQIQKVDGNTIDRISLKFTGEVFLNRSDPADVAVYNELRLGRDVQILIEAKCSSTAREGRHRPRRRPRRRRRHQRVEGALAPQACRRRLGH